MSMKYFIKGQDNSALGPYTVEEIEAWLATGELSGNALATLDTGESAATVALSSATGWLCVNQMPGVCGNPPMPGLGAPQVSTSPKEHLPASGAISSGEAVCRMCAKRLPPGDNLCRECAEHLARTGKQSARPHFLVVLLVQVPGGFIAQAVSFIFLCGFFGLSKPQQGTLILCAVMLCVFWAALASRMMRNPAYEGYAVGILLGVCLTALLTGTCAMSK